MEDPTEAPAWPSSKPNTAPDQARAAGLDAFALPVDDDEEDSLSREVRDTITGTVEYRNEEDGQIEDNYHGLGDDEQRSRWSELHIGNNPYVED